VNRRDDALVRAALLSCVRQDPGAEVAEVVRRGQLRRLVDAGRSHRVLNLVHLAVADVARPDDDLAAGLHRYYLHQVGHHLRATADLATLARPLDDAGIDWLLVKGPVLSEVLYDRPDLRVYNDLDVVIARDAFPAAIEALRSAGFDLLDQNWDLIRREGRAQLHLELQLGTVADVHHHLLNRAVVRESLTLPMQELFGRARRVRVGRVEVRTLDPVDTLVHLCVHAALAGGQRLLWLKDVDRSVASDAPPWDEVVRRSRSWRASALVAVILRRARDRLGVPVPSSVLRDLFRSSTRASFTALVDRSMPVEPAPSRISPAELWAQVVRDSWPATARALGRRALRPLLKATGRVDAGEDWAHARPRGAGSSGHADASDYLRDVTDPNASADAG
jgi:Uncharacterised nucleotidyltransferase